jgi:hypothetical protein
MQWRIDPSDQGEGYVYRPSKIHVVTFVYHGLFQDIRS